MLRPSVPIKSKWSATVSSGVLEKLVYCGIQLFNPCAVARLLTGSDVVKQETEAAIAQYAELNRSIIAQNTARLAAAEAGLLSLQRAKATSVPSTTGIRPAQPARGALKAITAAAHKAGGVEAPTRPLEALHALRASLERLATQRRQAPSDKQADTAAVFAAAVICPHVPLPPKPIARAATQPPPPSLLTRHVLWRASGIRPTDFWQKELRGVIYE